MAHLFPSPIEHCATCDRETNDREQFTHCHNAACNAPFCSDCENDPKYNNTCNLCGNRFCLDCLVEVPGDGECCPACRQMLAAREDAA